MTVPRRKKILIADDDLVVLKVLSLKLSSVGYDVVKVFDSGLVTRRIAEEMPDLILLDLDFGATAVYGHVEWDGLKMLEWMMRLEDLARIPVIIITASTAPKKQTTLPTERSIWPATIIKTMPTERIPVTDICLKRLLKDRKSVV